jgi:penicillin-binding protein 1A
VPVDPKNPRPRRRRGFAFWAKRVVAFGLSLALGGAVAGAVVVKHYESELPPVSELKVYQPAQVTRVLARDGTVLAELFVERRTVVAVKDIPAHVKLAFLAAEDAGFYEHEGLNYVGIARAMAVNLKSGRTRQGGSTITQQVVKNMLLDSERSYRRKIREALLSRRLEQELSKDEILELYLNHIYFGHGRYGIEEAARDVFGRPVKDLTIGEAALLAGLPAGPELYAPRRDLKKSLARRSFVLSQMLAKGFVSQAQFDQAQAEPVRLSALTDSNAELAPEAVQIARKLLHELEPARAARGGFTITTTIDPKLQVAARKAVRDGLSAYDHRHGLDAALKAPAVPVATRGKMPKPVVHPRDVVFEGTPSFESHKIYNGVVQSADDTTGLIEVRVGTAIGTFKLGDYERYNPKKLLASAWAPAGAKLRVSLLAPLPAVSADAPKEGAKANMHRVPLRLEQGPEGAFVALDVRTREVLALVGNYEAVPGGLDRAMQSRRQPGSTFKPVLYSYALSARRFTPASLIDVNPTVFAGGYKPANYEGWTEKDPLRLREALANSVNVAAVRVMDDVGPQAVVEWARGMGVTSTLKPDLSLALGAYEVEPIELVGVYATLAAGGTYEAPRVVTRIVGPDGKEVELPRPAPSRRVMDESVAYVTTSMLTSVVDHGTATRAKELKRPVAGKTGTSNEGKDTWFAGYSTDIAAVSWVGYDDGKPLGGGEAGGVTALPIWVSFMKTALEGRPKLDFPRPAGVVAVTIDKTTGKLPYEGDTDTIEEVFLQGTEPTETAEPKAFDAGADAEAGTE